MIFDSAKIKKKIKKRKKFRNGATPTLKCEKRGGGVVYSNIFCIFVMRLRETHTARNKKVTNLKITKL